MQQRELEQFPPDATRREEVAISGLADILLERIAGFQERIDQDGRRPLTPLTTLARTVERWRGAVRLIGRSRAATRAR